MFVDDFVIHCTRYDVESVYKYLQIYIDRIDKLTSNNSFKFSPSQTLAVHFTRSRQIENIPPLLHKSMIITYKECVKFLGMKFD